MGVQDRTRSRLEHRSGCRQRAELRCRGRGLAIASMSRLLPRCVSWRWIRAGTVRSTRRGIVDVHDSRPGHSENESPRRSVENARTMSLPCDCNRVPSVADWRIAIGGKASPFACTREGAVARMRSHPWVFCKLAGILPQDFVIIHISGRLWFDNRPSGRFHCPVVGLDWGLLVLCL